MINADEFRKQLQCDFAYSTPERVQRGFWYRHFGWTDWLYRCAVLGIVIRGARLSRSGLWSQASWLDLSLGMVRVVEGCGGRVAISGCEHLAALKAPAVIVANHMSLLETFALPCMILPFLNVAFVIKDSLTRIPLMKDVMKGSCPISVGRKNPREDLKKIMEEGPKVIEAGRSVVIFPQATRDPQFSPAMFNTLGLKLAKRAGVPLVPLALKTDLHGLGGWIRDFGPVDRSKGVYFKFGPALAISGSGRDAHDACVRFISDTLRGWGGNVETRSNG